MTAPTIQQISDTLTSQLQSQLNQSIPLLPRSFTAVLARSIAALFVILYKYSGFIALQSFVGTATANETEINGRTIRPLLEWGRLIRVPDPVPAVQAELTLAVSVVQEGATLRSGTQLIEPNSGVLYITTAPVLLTGAQVTVVVRAAADQLGAGGAGSLGNQPNGARLSFANPLGIVGRTAIVLNTVTTGSDAETIESYRQRVINRFQRLPQGGAYADYALWASDSPNVRNVYPYTASEPGVVDVYIESNADADGIPTQAVLNEVRDLTYTPTRRPANALARPLAITRRTFDVQVSGLSAPNFATVQTQINAALAEYFRQREPFIEGLSAPPRADRVTRSGVISVIISVAAADGGTIVDATVSSDLGAVSVYELEPGEKARLGSVSYV